MKINIILVLAILIVLNYFNIFSQDIIDPPKLIQLETESIVQREPDRFVRGWTCGSPGNMLDSAMYINTYYSYHRDYYNDTNNNSTHNLLIINRPGHYESYLVAGRDENVAFNTQSLYLEPSLIVDTTQNFTPRANDNTGAAMGFLYRNNIVSHDSIAPNGNGFFVLEKNSITTGSVEVLSNIWKKDCLRWFNYGGTNSPGETNDSIDIADFHPFNGKQFYISINLRALNLDEIQQHYNDTILKIVLPYEFKTVTPLGFHFQNSCIKFNYLPSDYIGPIYGSRGDYRGCFRYLYEEPNKPTEFVIKGWMLQSSDTITNQITISALASFDGKIIDSLTGEYLSNPVFQPEQSDDRINQYITLIDVDVQYCGNLDIAIDWIKLETPRAQQIFRGAYDTQVSNAVDLTISDLKTKNNYYNPRLFGFYGPDEIFPNQWAVTRYFNMLLDTLATLETFTHYENDPPHYLHATGMNRFWNGSNIDLLSSNGVPFVRRSDASNPTMTFNYVFGFAGNTNDFYPDLTLDSLRSGYETRINCNKNDSIHNDNIPVLDLDIYNHNYINDNILYYYPESTQFQIEKLIYNNYYKKPSLFYSSKPWWANLWTQSDGLKYYNSDIQSFTIESWKSRPKTGEEIRLMATLPVLLGAKGLMYWFKSTSKDYDDPAKVGKFIGLQPYSEDYSSLYGSLSGEELLKSNVLGGDYVCFPDANNLDDVYNNDAYLFDIMGIDSNHIYIGLASTRLAISRVNKWVQNCENELMKLRLVAWYGKGFLTLYHQDPAFVTDTIMKNFLSLDVGKIKTRQIDRYFQFKYVNPDYEPWDSSFVDITLLRNIDTTMNDVFYVSALNRRTDPLIYYQPPSSSGTPPNPYIRFLSTSEFEDSCDATKNPNGYERIRSYWWEKLGAREVSIKFNYQNSENNDEYALLRVTEIGAEEEFDENWSYGKKQSFWNKIDTVIGQDSRLPIKLQPAEGKIFRIQVIHQDTTVTGILAHSNQSKLIMHPVLDEEGNETDIIRYHLVYFKPIVGNPNINGVYYRRSLPISKDCMEENIIWEPEILVSDSTIDEGGNFNNLVSCDYPSIVVRKDSDTLKAYIVFSCFKNRSRSFIAETKLYVNTSGLVQDRNGYELNLYNGNNRAEWGNPVVNASSNGNYYAWSDSTAGTVAAWKSSDALRFQASNKINFKFNSGNKAQHPSLNVYSDIDNNEDNCSLVWQEESTLIAQKRILYTRLRQNGTSLYKYLSPNYSGSLALLDTLNNIASLIDTSFNLCFPVINRIYYNYGGLTNISERVYWGAIENSNLPQGNYLMNCYISNTDINNIPYGWYIYSKNYIRSYYKFISFPNISYTIPASPFSLSDGVALNFRYWDTDRINYIGHFAYYNHSFVSNGLNDYSDMNLLWVKPVDKGIYSHLAKKKFKENAELPSIFWRNRRVYQKTIDSSNHILSSAKYFYKGQSDEMLADWYIGFETADSSKKSFLFGAPELDEQRFSLKLPFEKVVSDEGYFTFVEASSDTIASSWFSIEDAKELALKLKGSNNANSRVYIQNKETERTLRLNLPNGLKENKGAKAKYNLINGLGNEFRLLFVKNDEAMNYTEELWIEGLPIEEKPAGSFKGNDGIENVDLIQIVNRYYSDHNISIFPNPASEVLYLQANVPFEEANLTVTNLLGTKVIQQQIDLSSSPELKLDISFLLPGIYYVNISDGLSSISGKFLKK